MTRLLSLLLVSTSALACGGIAIYTEPDASSGSGGSGGASSTGSRNDASASTGDTESTSAGTEPGPSVATSTGSGPTNPQFECGLEFCQVDAQECCISMQGAGCVDAGSDCPGPLLGCSDATNCTGGEVCCWRGGFDGEAECRDTCGDGQGPGGGGIQLCATDEECLNGEPCQQTNLGVSVCGDFGGPGGDGGEPPPPPPQG